MTFDNFKKCIAHLAYTCLRLEAETDHTKLISSLIQTSLQ
jgi:hypothetical protein